MHTSRSPRSLVKDLLYGAAGHLAFAFSADGAYRVTRKVGGEINTRVIWRVNSLI